MADRQSYESAFRSREVVRASPSVTLTKGRCLMTMAVGIDNRGILPPFLPVLRGEDGLFAAMLGRRDGGTYIAHLPWVIEHAPPDARAWQEHPVGRGVASLLKCFVESLDDGSHAREPFESNNALARMLVRSAAQPTRDFQAQAWEFFATEFRTHIALLERMLEHWGGQPSYWAKDVRRVIESVEAALAARSVSLLDIDDDDPWGTCQRLVGQFGHLLEAWGEIRAAARALVESDRIPAQQV